MPISSSDDSRLPPRPIRVALLRDYPEEGWPSMDLTAEMIAGHLATGHPGEVEITPVVPPYRARLARQPIRGRLAGVTRNTDRLLNRYVDYPKHIRNLVRNDPGRFDLFHLVDHSYAQLLHVLPAGRTIVSCHDLDTFRCLLDPAAEPRPAWFRALVKRTLSGFRKAARVACGSRATRDALAATGWFPDDRLAVIPHGIAPEFAASGSRPDPAADAEANSLLGPIGPHELLHVGSTIPRKRIDVLLDTFAAVRRERPDARLVRIGAPFTPGQFDQARALGLLDAIAFPPFLDRPTLAAVYRRAAVVLQPSEAEGFGLPLAEALACGAVPVASDLPVLREVAGDAATYCPVADLPAWSASVLALLSERERDPSAWSARRALGLAHASRFSWPAHAVSLVELYRSTLAEISN